MDVGVAGTLVAKFALICSRPMNFLAIMVISRSVMTLTVTPSVWFTLSGVRFVMPSMWVKLIKSFGCGGIITDKTKGGQGQGLTISNHFSTHIGLIKVIMDWRLMPKLPLLIGQIRVIPQKGNDSGSTN